MKWQKATLTAVMLLSIFLVYSMAERSLTGQTLDASWQDVGKSQADQDPRAIVIDPLNPNKAYLATDRGLMVTDDAGKSWSDVLDLVEKKLEVTPDMAPRETAALSRMSEKMGAITGATAVAIDPSNPSSLFVGSPHGLYRTDDAGVSWTEIDSGFSGKSSTITGLAISSSNPDIVYCATLGGLMKSSDAGKTWSAAGVADPVNCVAIHPFNPDVVYAGILGAAKKTENGGAEWVDLVAGPGELNVLSIATDSLDPKDIYFGTDRGLYKSEDEGMSWSKLGLAGSVEQVAISPADSTLVYAATSKGVYASSDSGQEWKDISDGIPSQEGRALAFDPIDRDRLWVVGDKGVFLGSMGGSSPAPADADKLAGLGYTSESTAPPADADKLADLGYTSESTDATEPVAPTASTPATETAPVETAPVAQSVASAPVVETVPVAVAQVEEVGPPIPTMDDVKTVLSQFAFEPTVQEIQEVAMRFAEVHPDKIESWRRGARWRAFLPEVKLKFAHTRQETQTDQLTWERDEEDFIASNISDWIAGAATGSSRTLDDEVETTWNYELETEHEREWEDEVLVEMKWELGDFLYSKSQVDISDEAAELAEFRNEVLEQVTQFYFQRRQFQVDLLLSPPEDLRERIRMEIQLQEMTANIDYLTGGYITARINEARFGKQAQEEGFVRGLFRR